MTLFICQVPHQGPAKCWTAAGEDEAISLIQDEFPNAEDFATLHNAIIFDKATAEAVDNPFDLFGVFYWDTLRPRSSAAISAIISTFAGYARDELQTDPDHESYKIAFNGTFVYDEDEGYQILGNDRIEGDIVTLLFEHYAKTMMETKHVDI